MSQHLVVVDGYNVIMRSPRLAPGPERSLEQARDKLVNLLSWAVGSGEARLVVVFDGSGLSGPARREGRVEVRYSTPPRTADDDIRRLVEDEVERVERVTVVTSDLDVARHARAMGAQVSLADLFLASLLPPGEGEEPEKPPALSKREIEEWAEIFRRRAPGGDPEA